MKSKDYIYEKSLEALDYLRNFKKCNESRKRIRKTIDGSCVTDAFGKLIPVKDIKKIKKSLMGYAAYYPEEAALMAERMVSAEFRVLKSGNCIQYWDKPTFVCIVKNDLERVRASYEYHRGLGLERFVFVDNGSDDGTIEYLMEQDVDLFQTTDSYASYARAVWLVRLFACYGYNKWYLIVDSDEFFTYPHMEDYNINEFIEYLEKQGISRCLSFMLDMYSEGGLKQNDSLEIDTGVYRYFDKKNYCLTRGRHFPVITGGPRERMTGNDTLPMYQQKYPLVKIDMGDIYRYHYAYPFAQNLVSNCFSVLRHYKFLPGDIEKYRQIARDGNYAKGSYFYKKLIKSLDAVEDYSFMDDNSTEYVVSEDILKTGIVMDWIGE